MITARRRAFSAHRRAVLVACAIATVAGLAGAQRAPALPGTSPPPRLDEPMRWAHVPPAARRLDSAAAFSGRRAVVGLSPGVDAAALTRSLQLHLVRRIAGLRAVEVAGTSQALSALAGRRDARVRYVEPVTRLQQAHVRNDPLTYENDRLSGVPYEWSFHAVGADQALNLGKGDPSILVGVLDSGISAVPDLQGKVATTLWDPSTSSSSDDSQGHGTLVSSIVAANDDDGIGLAGFCGACRLAVYKAFPLNSVEVANGLRMLTDAHVRIINISLVGQTSSNVLTDALNYALAAGVLVVAATGNDSAAAVDFPASYLQASGGTAGGGLSVGASDADGKLASFSNYGTELSLLAPGTFNDGCLIGIIGAISKIATDFDSGTGCAATLFDLHNWRYAYANGTSFSAPEVAGTAALVWAAEPSLTSVQVADVLEQTASRPPGTGWTPTAGWGVLDANAALENVTGRSSGDALRLTAVRVAGTRTPGHTVRATVGATWDDGSAVVAGASPRCRVAVGHKTVTAGPSLAKGVLACSFKLPARSSGLRATGTISLSAETAPTMSARFAFTVARA